MSALSSLVTASTSTAARMRSSISRSLPDRLDVRQRVAVLVIIAVILVLRKPDALLQPQFIADDALLFRDALTDGLSAVLWPYAGYLLVAPRFAAWLGIAIAPVSAVPLVYSLISLAAILFTCARLMSPRIPVRYAWLAALVVPLVPHDGEVYLNVCYIQWTLILTAYVLFMVDAPTSPLAFAGDAMTLALVGLSGPFIFPVVPFYWLRSVRAHSDYRTVMTVIVTCAAIAQLYTVISTGTLEEHAAGANVVTDGIIAIGTKLIGVTFLGRHLTYDLPWVATALAGVAIATALFFALAPVGGTRNRTLLTAFLSGSLIYSIGAVLRVKENALNLVPFHHGDRYFFNPRFLLIACLLLALTTRGRLIAAVLLVLVGLSTATTFRARDVGYHDWSQWSSRIERREPTVITVSPYNWQVEIPAKRP